MSESVRLIKYNKDNKGLDENDSPTFYSEKYSKIEVIEQILIQHYNANRIEDGDGFTNLRQEANKQSPILGKINTGQQIKVLNNTGQWWPIETVAGKKGYVYWTRIKS